jgi:mannose-1-phosphate guanylyltransferase
MKNTEEFQKALTLGEELINDNPERFVFIGEKPRFPNHNLGWITVGDRIDRKNGLKISQFEKWRYRPPLEEAKELFESGKSFWNPGYFVTSIDFVLDLYKKHQPKMYEALERIAKKPQTIDKAYQEVEALSFDDAIISKTAKEAAVVIEVDMGWSDPGTLYALKESLQETPEANVEKGKLYAMETKDSLIYNYEEDKFIATIGLEGIIIVNTKDALLVVDKGNAHKVADLVDQLRESEFKDFT